MGVISDKDKQFIKDLFGKTMAADVTVVCFTQHDSPLSVPSTECMYCKETRELLEEVSELSDKIKLEVHDFVGEADLAREYGVERIPATVLKGAAKGMVRFYGIPAGYEFSSLVEDIVDVSKGTTDLTEATKAELAKLDKDVHIQVFFTPT